MRSFFRKAFGRKEETTSTNSDVIASSEEIPSAVVVLHEVNVHFALDLTGIKLKELWDAYCIARMQENGEHAPKHSKSGVDDNNNEEEVKDSPSLESSLRVDEFATLDTFLSYFNNCYGTQNLRRVLGSVPDPAPDVTEVTPDSSFNCLGHPSAFLIDIASLIIDRLHVENSDAEREDDGSEKSSNTVNSRGTDRAQVMSASKSVRLGGGWRPGHDDGLRYSVADMHTHIQNNGNENEESPNPIRLASLLQCLSILVSWDHNRRILSSHIGRKFVFAVISLVSTVGEQLPPLVDAHLYPGTIVEVVEGETPSTEEPRLDELHSKMTLSLNLLLILVQLLGRSHFNTGHTDDSNTGDGPPITDFLPEQPWNNETLSYLGFTLLGKKEEDSNDDTNNNEESDDSDGFDYDSDYSIDLNGDDSIDESNNYHDSSWLRFMTEAEYTHQTLHILEYCQKVHDALCLFVSRNDKYKSKATSLLIMIQVLELECLHVLRYQLQHYINNKKIEMILSQSIKRDGATDSLLSGLFASIRELFKRNITAISEDGGSTNAQQKRLQELLLRRGILCFSIVDTLATTSFHLNSAIMKFVDLPEGFRVFIAHMKNAFDVTALDSNTAKNNAREDLKSVQINCEYWTRFTNSGKRLFDLWPWSQDDSLKVDSIVEGEEKEESPVEINSMVGKQVLLRSKDSHRNKKIFSFKLLSRVEDGDDDDDDDDRTNTDKNGNDSDGEQEVPRLTRQDSRKEERDAWNWSHAGRGASAWYHLFRYIFAVFCQYKDFKTLEAHQCSLRWLIEGMLRCDENIVNKKVLNTGQVMLPIMQYSFLGFMSTIAQSDDKTVTYACEHIQFWSVLRGRLWLCGGSTQINNNLLKLFSYKEQGTVEADRALRCFSYNKENNESDTDLLECLESIAWLSLHDSILIYAYQYLKSMYKLEKHFTGNARLKILFNLSDIIANNLEEPFARNDAASPLSYDEMDNDVNREKGRNDSVTVSGIFWISRVLTDFIWEDDVGEILPGRDSIDAPISEGKIITQVFNELILSFLRQANSLMHRHTSINGLSSFRKSDSFAFDEKRNPFLWPARSLVMQIILELTQQKGAQRLVDMLQPGISSQLSSAAKPQRARSISDASNRLTASVKTERRGGESTVTPVSSPPRSGILLNGEMSGREDSTSSQQGRLSTNEVLLLMLDPRITMAAIGLVYRIVYTCCTEVASLTVHNSDVFKSSDGTTASLTAKALQAHENYQKSIKGRTKFLMDILETIFSGVLDIVTNLPGDKKLESYKSALDILNAITCLLRAEDSRILRHVMQEVLHKTSAVPHLFLALNLWTKSSDVRAGGGAEQTEYTVLQTILQKILRQALSLMTASMIDYPANMLFFAANIGLGGGPHYLFLKYENKPSLETVIVLLEMMLCQSFSKRVHSYVHDPRGLVNYFDVSGSEEVESRRIANVCVIPTIFYVLRYCDPITQQFVLKLFNLLTSGKSSIISYNLQACTQCLPQVLNLLLTNITYWSTEEAHEESVTLMSTLGKHKMDVHELKFVFKTLITLMNEGDHHRNWLRILRAMKGMVGDGDGPRTTFVFEGVESGLLMPPITKWPATRFFSFCVWLRVDRGIVKQQTAMGTQGVTGVSMNAQANGKLSANNVPRVPRQGRASSRRSSRKKLGSVASAAPQIGVMEYTPCILSLVDNDGYGIELCLEPNIQCADDCVIHTTHESEYNLELRYYGESADSKKSGIGRQEVLCIPGQRASREGDHNHKHGSHSHNDHDHSDSHPKRSKGVIREGQWHFVAFTMATGASKVFRESSRAAIVIDDCYHSQEFPFPKFSGNIQYPVIGESGLTLSMTNPYTAAGAPTPPGGSPGASPGTPTSIPSMSSASLNTFNAMNRPSSKSSNPSTTSGYSMDAMSVKAEYDGEDTPLADCHTTFRGQMGAVYFFNASLSRDQLEIIRGLGYDYFYCFEPDRHSEPTDDAAYRQLLQEDKALHSSVMLAYNPAVHKGHRFLDNSPKKNKVAWRYNNRNLIFRTNSNGTNSLEAVPNDVTEMHLTRQKGTFGISTQKMRRALDSLGGNICLTPIIPYLDLKSVDSFEDQLFSAWVALLGRILEKQLAEKDMASRAHIKWNHIAYNLESISPKHFTIEAFNNFVTIHNVYRANGDTNKTLVANILFNFKLWAFTSMDVQLYIYKQLQLICDTVDIGVSATRLVDKIYMHYDYGLGDDRCLTALRKCKVPESYLQETHYLAGVVQVRKPIGRDRLLVRELLFAILKIRLHKQLDIFAIENVLRYLVFTYSATAKCEYMSLLFGLLLSEDMRVVVATWFGIAKGGGIPAIAYLAYNSDLNVRFYSMLLIAKVLSSIDRIQRYFGKGGQLSKDMFHTPSLAHEYFMESLMEKCRDLSTWTLEGMLGLLQMHKPEEVGEFLLRYQQSILSHVDPTKDMEDLDKRYQVKLVCMVFFYLSFGKPVEVLLEYLSAQRDEDLKLSFTPNFREHVVNEWRFPSEDASDVSIHVSSGIMILMNILKTHNSLLSCRDQLDIILHLQVVLTPPENNLGENRNILHMISNNAWQVSLLDLIATIKLRHSQIPPLSLSSVGEGASALTQMEEHNTNIELITRHCEDILMNLCRAAMVMGGSLYYPHFKNIESDIARTNVQELIEDIVNGSRSPGAATIRSTLLYLLVFQNQQFLNQRISNATNSTYFRSMNGEMWHLAEQLASNSIVDLNRTSTSQTVRCLSFPDSLIIDQKTLAKLHYINVWITIATVVDLVYSNVSFGYVVCEHVPISSVWTMTQSILKLNFVRYSLRNHSTHRDEPVPTLSPNKVSRQHHVFNASEKGGLFWCLLRLLTFIVSRSGLKDDSVMVWLPAFHRLVEVITYCMEEKYAFIQYEICYIIVSISTPLADYLESHVLPSKEVMAVFKYVSQLLYLCKDAFIAMLAGISKKNYLLEEMRSEVVHNPRTIFMDHVHRILGSLVNENEMMAKSYSHNDLGYMSEIRWREWSILCTAMTRDAEIEHKACINARLVDMGLYDLTSDKIMMMVKTPISHACRDGIPIYAENYKSYCLDIYDQCANALTMHIDITFNAWYADRAFDTKDMKEDIGRLINERGPWGDTDAAGNETLWSLAASTTDTGMRMLLVPNKDANRHRMASQLQRGSKEDDSKDTKETEESGLEGLDFLKRLMDYRKTKDTKGKEEEEGDDLDATMDLGDIGEDDKVNDSEIGPALLLNLAITDVEFEEEVEIVTPVTNGSAGRSLGKIQVTPQSLSYKRNNESKNLDLSNVKNRDNREFEWACELFANSTWGMNDIRYVYDRSYQLREVAVEIFFLDRKSVFIAFESTQLRNRFVYKLQKMKPKHMTDTCWYTGKLRILVNRADPKYNNRSLIEAWQRREITNFEYLMQLNRIAGRSFNDLAQYPVFPWIIADYKSSKLDLRNEATYRDLKWPIQAQSDKLRNNMMEEYNVKQQMYDDEELMMPPRHSGSHYSQGSLVMTYLIRMEPFTSLHVWFFAGKFDKPDRLFRSIQTIYDGCTGPNSMDVKELIPEFFYSPDFLRNINGIDLGTTQGGTVLGDVELPPWASSAHDFIVKNREALESEYVSQNLHHWVDLIFGVKSRPPSVPGGTQQCVDACNVYIETSYPGYFKLEELKASSSSDYEMTIKKIMEFGQTPKLLFSHAHATRRKLINDSTALEHNSHIDITWPLASAVNGFNTILVNQGRSTSITKKQLAALKKDRPNYVQCFESWQISTGSVLFIAELEASQQLISMDIHRVLGIHQFTKRASDHLPPYSLKPDQYCLRLASGDKTLSSIGSLLKSNFGTQNMSEMKTIGEPFASWGFASNLHSAKEIVNFSPAKSDDVMEEEAVRADKYYGIPSSWRKAKQSEGDKQRDRHRQDRDRHRSDRRGTTVGEKSNDRDKEGERDRSTVVSGTTTAATSPVSSTPSSTPSRSRSHSRSDRGERSGDRNREKDRSRTRRLKDAYEETGDIRSNRRDREDSDGRSRSVTVESRNNTTGAQTSKIWETERVNDYLTSNMFAVLPQHKLLFSCGYWDNSFKVCYVDSNTNVIQTVRQHQEVVTCLTVGCDEGRVWLLTGSKDCTIRIWNVYTDKADRPIDTSAPVLITGHDDTINCIALNPDMDMFVSASDDGTMMVYTLRENTYIRTIVFNELPSSIKKGGVGGEMELQSKSTDVFSPNSNSSPAKGSVLSPSTNTVARNDSRNSRVNMVCISIEGYIVAYSCDGHYLHTYSLNSLECKGPLRRISVGERLYTMVLSIDGKVLVTGGAKCLVIMRWIKTLLLANDGARKRLAAVIDGSADGSDNNSGTAFESPIRSLFLTRKDNLEAHLIVGLESGHMRILAQDSEYLRRRLHNRLATTGFY